MCCVVIYDKCDVNLITTLHDVSTAAVLRKTNRDTGQPIIKPVAILDCNRHMGAVDKSDQMVLVNSSMCKPLKWIKKLFFHLLDLSTTNAYIIYCKQEKKVKHLHFVQQIIQHLVSNSIEDGDVSGPVQAGCFSLESPNLLCLEFSASRHWPKPIPATERKPKPRRECIVCKSHWEGTGKRWVKGGSHKWVETQYICGGCEGEPALCISPCFELYHTRKDYWGALC